MVSINPIIGKTIIPEPIFETIWKNPVVVPFSCVILNAGKSNSGKPDGILPGTCSYDNYLVEWKSFTMHRYQRTNHFEWYRWNFVRSYVVSDCTYV